MSNTNGTGNGLANFLIGNDGDNTLNGSAGNDEITGGLGSDAISGGDGADTLYGNDGADILYGNVGQDVIQGGAGADTINGGDGADELYGFDGTDTILGGDGGADADCFVFLNDNTSDTIEDFSASEGDKIDLSAISGITDWNDLVQNHISTPPLGGAANTIIFGSSGEIHVSGVNLLNLSASDFIFA